MGLMACSILLVLVTLLLGFNIDDNPMFLFAESVLNLVILVDFGARVKLMGYKRFFEGGFWNVFDAVVVSGCVLLFVMELLSKSGVILIFEEVSEEILLLCWSLFQTLRMIFIAKKQKLA